MKVWVTVEVMVDDDTIITNVYGSKKSAEDALIKDAQKMWDDVNEGNLGQEDSDPKPTDIDAAIEFAAESVNVLWEIHEKEVL